VCQILRVGIKSEKWLEFGTKPENIILGLALDA
jgi:hypothetical protein